MCDHHTHIGTLTKPAKIITKTKKKKSAISELLKNSLIPRFEQNRLFLRGDLFSSLLFVHHLFSTRFLRGSYFSLPLGFFERSVSCYGNSSADATSFRFSLSGRWKTPDFRFSLHHLIIYIDSACAFNWFREQILCISLICIQLLVTICSIPPKWFWLWRICVVLSLMRFVE